ncbi:hypothetical protein BcFMB_00965 [Bifidobacterium choerinum]|uniref:Uncharacterized protein n=1 Tax=Bifidobacterium choerinum TaxID=35760 RepID=A0A2D3D4F6_9BIFI|nr:hypothetical protein BcFMB_00965 [Bifidobacterium choerinum]
MGESNIPVWAEYMGFGVLENGGNGLAYSSQSEMLLSLSADGPMSMRSYADVAAGCRYVCIPFDADGLVAGGRSADMSRLARRQRMDGSLVEQRPEIGLVACRLRMVGFRLVLDRIRRGLQMATWMDSAWLSRGAATGRPWSAA